MDTCPTVHSIVTTPKEIAYPCLKHTRFTSAPAHGCHHSPCDPNSSARTKHSDIGPFPTPISTRTMDSKTTNTDVYVHFNRKNGKRISLMLPTLTKRLQIAFHVELRRANKAIKSMGEGLIPRPVLFVFYHEDLIRVERQAQRRTIARSLSIK